MSALFNNDPGSCGPSNPLLSLSKHTNNTDNSFLQQHNKRPTITSNEQVFNTSNRLNRIDHHLDQEFQQFNNHHVQPQHFQPLQNLPIQHHHQQQPLSSTSSASASNQWSQDFSKLSLNEINNYNTPLQQQKASSQRFNNAANTWNHEFTQQQHHQQPLQHHNIISTTNLLANPQQLQPRHLTEHEELHKVAADLGNQQSEFENMFNQIEQEITPPPLQPIEQQQKQLIKNQLEYDKDKFAQTAKLVANAMSQKTQKANLMSKKFENSNFLKLMNQVSEKNVVINDEGDAFVLNK